MYVVEINKGEEISKDENRGIDNKNIDNFAHLSSILPILSGCYSDVSTSE